MNLRQALCWLARGVLCLLSVVVLWQASRAVQFNPTDYVAWQNDWTTVTHCIDTDAASCPGVSKFPLAYLFNAGLAGWNRPAERVVLTLLNLHVLMLPVLAYLWLQGRHRAAGAIYPYIVAVLLSPLPLFYIASGALELQSAVFSGLYLGLFARVLTTADVTRDNTSELAWLAFAGLMFPLYKDTIAAFVCVACVLLLWVNRHRLKHWTADVQGRQFMLRAALVAVGPVAIAVGCSLYYNALRYATPLPFAYMEEARQTLPALSKSAEFFAGSILSPNGGALVFWMFPIAVALVGWRLEGFAPRRAALIGAAAVFLCSALAFARWWAPFGWDSWGNRLLIPSAFALIVAAFVSLRPKQIREHLSARARISAFVAVPLVLCSALYIAAPYLAPAGQAMPDSLWSGPACGRMQQALPDQALAQGMAFWKSETYYACARERMLHVPAPR